MDSGFHLAKWYLDCIAEDGTTVIGYAARLSWKQLSLHYASLLRCGPDRTPDSSTSLFASDFPVQNNDTIEWSCKGLSVRGAWKQKLTPVERTLLQNELGFIRWTCHMPGAEAAVTVGNETVRGLGYAEFLEMTIPPWKLPIDELRWGRFVSPTDSLVWIDWKGSHPLELVLHNGSVIDCSMINDSMIRSTDGSMVFSMDRSTVIRSGALINTALKRIPLIESVVPKNIVLTDECKWLSRSMLQNNGQTTTGFSIHEIVRFV